jgi:hypothetical protein
MAIEDVLDDVVANMVQDVANDLANDYENDEGNAPPIDKHEVDDMMTDWSLYTRRHAFLKMQGEYDSFNCPIACQDSTIHQLFDGLELSNVHVKDPKFGTTLRHMPTDWNRELDRGDIVKSWQ